jgi:hypothetical protein
VFRCAQASLLIAILCVGACAGSDRGKPDATALPDDFALSVTVLPASGLSPSMVPAWYVLRPDGVLHAALGERLPASPAPPAVRTLSRDQVHRVWELVVQGGLVKGQGAALPEWQTSVPGSAAIVYVGAWGRRRTSAVPADRVESVEPVVAELRRLGWVEGK